MHTPPQPPCEVRASAIHGHGLFAVGALEAGTTLGMYEGRRFLPEQIAMEDWDSGLTYLFALSDGSMIDGAQGGNATRHLNHSCAPNCEAREEVGEDGTLLLRVTTLKPVASDEELFLDYALVIDESETASDYPCHCGADGCRGSMALPVR